MYRKTMSNPAFIVEQLEEALEERKGTDRRKQDVGSDPQSGMDRRQGDRRSQANTQAPNETKH